MSELPYRAWRYRWLRLYDGEGRLVPTGEESATAERQRAERERLLREQERQRAEAERQRAEAERQRAEQERLLREQAEQRLAVLEAELKRLRGES